MLVCPVEEVWTNRLRAAFPQQVRPPFAMTDFLGELGGTGLPRLDEEGEVFATSEDSWSGSDAGVGMVEYDPLARAVYTRALLVPHDAQINPSAVATGPVPATGRNDNPAMAYLVEPAASCRVVRRNFEYDALEWRFGTDHQPFSALGRASIDDSQGFTAVLSPEPLGQEVNLILGWRTTGTRGVSNWYGLLFSSLEGVVFLVNRQSDPQERPDPETWTRIDRVKQGDGRSFLLNPDAMAAEMNQNSNGARVTGQQPIVVEVRIIAGKMRVTIGSEDTPLLWPVPMTDPDTGAPDDQIDRFWVSGNQMRACRAEIHPTKFAPVASLVSGDINFGFDPTPGQIAATTFRVHFAPNSGTPPERLNSAKIGWIPTGTDAFAAIDSVNGTILRYRLTIDNGTHVPSSGSFAGCYVHRTAAISAVSLDTPGIEYSLINPWQILGNIGSPPPPAATVVNHRFDLETLSIQSSAHLTFDNFKGNWTNFMGSGVLDNVGHFAVGINLGHHLFGTRREFTGIANTTFENDWKGQGRDSVTVHCSDMWAALNEPVWNVAWMDGWNVYYAMAYLAALGGIPLSQCTFAPYVPTNPYAPSPGLPPSQQMYLGVGTAGQALSRFGGGQSIRNIMLQISKAHGFMLFFNIYGQLHFYKFQIPKGVAKIFRHVPGNALTGGFGLDEIITGKYTSSLESVRNSTTMIGVNAFGPIWDPVVAHAVDLDSMFNDSVPNYKGWNSPLVWTDNMFSYLPFAQATADAMLAFLRIPEKQVHFTTWYPTTPVYPGDIISVFYPRSGASLLPFFVTETTSTRAAGQLFTMNITGQLVLGTPGI